jgi:hypothetical protein
MSRPTHEELWEAVGTLTADAVLHVASDSSDGELLVSIERAITTLLRRRQTVIGAYRPRAWKDPPTPRNTNPHHATNTINDMAAALDAAETRIVELEREIEHARVVVRAALDLRNSGYDGPWIGASCEPLFSALAAWENRLGQANPTDEVRHGQ